MIKITADSTCDLLPEILKEFNISIIPLNIVVEDRIYKDSVDITTSDIFKFVEIENKECSTSAVNIYEYQKIFKEFSSMYDAVIHISLSSDLSSSYQNACVAAQNFKNVFVINSKNLSTGSGHLVYQAALMAKEGLNPQEIVNRLYTLTPKIESSFVIDQLDYLHKGGRCSALTKLGANVLKLKPCIEVKEGKMSVGKKYRGNFDSCIKKYVRDRLQDRDDINYDRIFITHAKCDQEILLSVKQSIQEYGNFKEMIITEAGCTISNHCGPNTLGIIFMRK